jgi:hypothetical protein
MTRFAAHTSVLAGGACSGLRFVAHDAEVLPRESYRMFADGVKRSRAVVAVLAESCRHDRRANHHKDAQADEQDQGWTN